MEESKESSEKNPDLEHKLDVADHLNSDKAESPDWISPLGVDQSREALIEYVKRSDWFENKDVFRNLTKRKFRIADIGAGNGDLAVELAQKYGDAEIVAVDRSPVSIRKNMVRLQDFENAITVGGDLNHVMNEMEEFDFIYAINVVQDADDPEEALKSMKKKLRPGGRMVVTLPGGGAKKIFPEHAHQDQSGKHFLYIESNEVEGRKVPWKQYFFPENAADELFKKLDLEIEEKTDLAADGEDLDKIMEMAGKTDKMEQIRNDNRSEGKFDRPKVNLYLLKK